jgi:hypothetical protein
MDDVIANEKWDAEVRLLDGNPLPVIHQPDVRTRENRPYTAAANLVIEIRFQAPLLRFGGGVEPCPGHHLDQLPHLLRKRHLVKQGINARLERGIDPTVPCSPLIHPPSPA